jgi:hypothetical protein
MWIDISYLTSKKKDSSDSCNWSLKESECLLTSPSLPALTPIWYNFIMIATKELELVGPNPTFGQLPATQELF